MWKVDIQHRSTLQKELTDDGKAIKLEFSFDEGDLTSFCSQLLEEF